MRQDLWVTTGVKHSLTDFSGTAGVETRPAISGALPFTGHVSQPAAAPWPSCVLGHRHMQRMWFSLGMCAKGVSHNVSLASQMFHELALPTNRDFNKIRLHF